MRRRIFVTLALFAAACGNDAGNSGSAEVPASQSDSTPGLGQVTGQNVCDRTRQVRDEIVRATAATSCEEVAQQDLAGISSLDLGGTGIDALQEGDFEGLTSLESLDLRYNNLAALPKGLFKGLSGLATLSLQGNDLTTLPEGWSSGLLVLQSLDLSDNSLTTLPERAFAGLPNLESLNLNGHSQGSGLTTLPVGVFAGMARLKSLDLSYNALTAFPEGVFKGLSGLVTLSLRGNGLRTLPEGWSSGLLALHSLDLADNMLATLSEEVFAGLPNLESLNLSGPVGRICTGDYSPDSCWMELADRPGCYLWNPAPQEDETVTWSGECSTDFAQGVGRVSWYESADLTQTNETRLQDGQLDGWTVTRGYGDDAFEAETCYVNGERRGRGIRGHKSILQSGRFRELSLSFSEGERIVVNMESDEIDSFLRVLREDGTEIAHDDDGGSGVNARVEFSVPATGQYTIRASAFSDEDSGRFVLWVGDRDPDTMTPGETCGLR